MRNVERERDKEKRTRRNKAGERGKRIPKLTAHFLQPLAEGLINFKGKKNLSYLPAYAQNAPTYFLPPRDLK